MTISRFPRRFGARLILACALGLGVVAVVVAEKVQHPVYHQMHGVVGEALALLRRFAGNGSVGEDDVAQQQRGSGSLGLEVAVLHQREGQNVGGLVLVPMFAVEGVHRNVVGEGKAEFNPGGTGDEVVGEHGGGGQLLERVRDRA